MRRGRHAAPVHGWRRLKRWWAPVVAIGFVPALVAFVVAAVFSRRDDPPVWSVVVTAIGLVAMAITGFWRFVVTFPQPTRRPWAWSHGTVGGVLLLASLVVFGGAALVDSDPTTSPAYAGISLLAGLAGTALLVRHLRKPVARTG